MTNQEIRALVTMGGIPLHGQERGNIQVFHALKTEGVDALFVTNEGYGHESVQPALDRLGLSWTTAPYPGRWIRRGVTAKHLWSSMKSLYACNRGFLKAARTYAPTHVHTMSERYALDLLPAIRKLKLPVVYRVGDAPRQHVLLFRFAWRRLIIPMVDTFVANSQYIRSKLIDAGVPEDRIQVIYTYPPDRPPLETTDLPADLFIPFSGRTVSYMGQLSEDKGVDLLVEAAIRICSDREDVRFLLAGDYTWRNPFANDLIARVREKGLSDRVRFLGFIEDIDRLLTLSDLHCAPSVWEEPLANTVLEAKRAGIPTVLFPSGGLPELVVDHRHDAYLCPEKTVDTLATGILHYLDLNDDELATASKAAAQSLSTLGISREAFTRAWTNVYATLYPPV